MSPIFLENLSKDEIFSYLERGIFLSGQSAIAKDPYADGYLLFPDATKGDTYDGLGKINGRDWVDVFKEQGTEEPKWRFIPNSEADGLARRWA